MSRRRSAATSPLTIHRQKCRFGMLKKFQLYKNRTYIYNSKQRLWKVENEERMIKIRTRFQQIVLPQAHVDPTIYFLAGLLEHALNREQENVTLFNEFCPQLPNIAFRSIAYDPCTVTLWNVRHRKRTAKVLRWLNVKRTKTKLWD